MGDKINYSVERLQFDEGDRAHIKRELLALKEKYSITDKVVVELGCGFGHNLELFKSDNRVSGLEGLQAAVDKARLNDLDVRLCDLNGSTPLVDSSVDLILCVDVLEHLVVPKTALAETYRALRLGGLAILNVPNHFDLSGRLKLLTGQSLDTHGYFPDHDEWDNPHIRFFTHDGFMRLVKESGLHVLEDRSSQITSFPFQSRLAPERFRKLRSRIAVRFPALFAAGHFLVAQKLV